MATFLLDATSWHNTLGSHAPVLRCADGDTVITNTLDAAGHDHKGVARAARPNPVNGPIFVEGAESGDALRVEILRMMPTRDTGWARSALAANVLDAGAVPCLPRERVTWLVDRENLTARLETPAAGLEDFVLPLAPMVGCFGVAPRLGQAISTATCGEHGGNMDYRGFGPGTTVWLPVAVPGALFALGDCHAAQGDGEIVGTGIETTFEVEIRLHVEKSRKLVWPRGETATDIFSVGNACPLDQALQHATTDMLNWLTADYGLSVEAASRLMGRSFATTSATSTTRLTRWSAALLRNGLLPERPAREGDELIDLRLGPVETGHQANDAAASTRKTDSGRRQGFDGRFGHCDEHEVGLDRRDQAHARQRRHFTTELRRKFVRLGCETQEQAVLGIRDELRGGEENLQPYLL
jgi:amidase